RTYAVPGAGHGWRAVDHRRRRQQDRGPYRGGRALPAPTQPRRQTVIDSRAHPCGKAVAHHGHRIVRGRAAEPARFSGPRRLPAPVQRHPDPTPISRPARRHLRRATAMTDTMRAVVLDAPGPPEALTIREVPRPAPAHGWVLIQVKAFG